MITTAECFYRMMRSTDCRIIVMILDDEQWKKVLSYVCSVELHAVQYIHNDEVASPALPPYVVIVIFSFQDDYADLPTEDEAVTCGKFEVHLESQEVLKNCIVRKLRLFSSVSIIYLYAR